MKVKSFRAPRLLVASVAQGRQILCAAWEIFCARKVGALVFYAVVLALALLVWPHDRAILALIHEVNGANDPAARTAAWYLGTWGDYPTYNIPFSLLLWIYGAATRNSTVRRIALVAFLGATLAGLCADCFRLTVGRARPDAHAAEGFYGIGYAFSGGYQSFPSGHAAADFGMAVALLCVNRALGLITLAFALAVVWARMELERHFPSDVIVGSAMGIYFGLLTGLGANRGYMIRSTSASPAR